MPWGLTRLRQSGQSHYVTFGCYHRAVVQKERTSGAESRIRFGRPTARVKLVPFPISLPCGMIEILPFAKIRRYQIAEIGFPEAKDHFLTAEAG